MCEEVLVSRQTYIEGKGEVKCFKKSKRCLKGGLKFPGKHKCKGCPYARCIPVKKTDNGGKP